MRKLKKRFFFALTSGLIFFLCGPACGQGDLIDRDHLLAQAEEKGNIRVIVAFNVPDLEKRQQTSRLIKVLLPGVKRSSSEFARAEMADGALAGAIRSSALSVFTNLGLEKRWPMYLKRFPKR